MRYMWFTRGRTWGYRFLETGGLSDPLPTFESAFDQVPDCDETYLRVGDKAALRLPDPLNRKDQSGRLIVHEFVLLPPLAGRMSDPQKISDYLWSVVADRYAAVWDRLDPTD